MGVLTARRAKPALPFAGVHRLIDFTLSSFMHSEFDDVWVAVQYQARSLDAYLAGGRPWSLDRNRGGFRLIAPQTETGPGDTQGFATGNADLLLRLADDIAGSGAGLLVVSSADHVCSADLARVVDEHDESGAALTMLTSTVTKTEARRKAVVSVADGGAVTGVAYKPARPESGLVAAEIFVYSVRPLLDALREIRHEEGGEEGLGDFGHHLLPRLIDGGRVRAVELGGYWRDVGLPEAYLEAHRDVLAGRADDVFCAGRPVVSHWPDLPASRLRGGCLVEDSIVSPGCDVAGEVVRSVLGPGTVVAAGARVEDSVLLDGVVVEARARVESSIVDEGCVVGERGRVGALAGGRRVREGDLAVLGMGVRVGPGAEVAPGTRCPPDARVR
ncbi:MAG: glucose-1-phosphate adenylyltransferase [Thermoleophilia bacterium]|nr:glucose-1-phosphate adenylyltransferase [Thermoleophilia bacterium]